MRIETSVTVAAVAIAATVAIAVVIWSLLRTILRTPDYIAMLLGRRRGERGYRAISRGLIAIGAGDARGARRAAGEARRIVPGEPLALLLDAQCAQIAGDRAAAEQAFRAMLERSDTKLLGLRGLFIEAQRRVVAHEALGKALGEAQLDLVVAVAHGALVVVPLRAQLFPAAAAAEEQGGLAGGEGGQGLGEAAGDLGGHGQVGLGQQPPAGQEHEKWKIPRI